MMSHSPLPQGGERMTDSFIEAANQLLVQENISWVQCHFTDIDGRIRSFTVPSSDLINGHLWEDGMTFDGSSIGFARTEDSDLRAVPDPATLTILPYGEGVQRIARVITDTYSPDGSHPFELDPRNALKRCREHLMGMGFKRAHLQPELEFYLFRDGSGIEEMTGDKGILEIQQKKGYFASIPLDNTDAFRNEFTSNLTKAGLDIKFHHHEGGADQVEIEFKHIPDIVECADAAMLYKLLSRLTAQRYGYFVSYMPKVSETDSGNGMHIHAWLEGEQGSAFVKGGQDMKLSETALHFIGGILKHARATCIVTNPTVNSYKRLLPKFEAPVYISWGHRNRTTMIRVPGSPGSKRVGDIEVRHADTSCNPYLAFTVLVQAGLEGIERRIEPPAPLDTDPNKLSAKEKRVLGIEQLPSSLQEAVDAALSDDFVKRCLGSALFDAIVERKAKEALEYRTHVSEWEIKKYLPL